MQNTVHFIDLDTTSSLVHLQELLKTKLRNASERTPTLDRARLPNNLLETIPCVETDQSNPHISTKSNHILRLTDSMIATATIVGIQLYDLSAGPPFKNKLITKFVAWEMIKISPTEFVALEFKSSKIIIIDWKAERVSEPVSLGDFSTLDYGHNVMAYLGNNELAIAQSGTVPGIGIYNVRTGKRIQIIGSVPLSGTSIAVIDADKLALGNSNSNIVGIYSRTTGSQIAQTGPSAGNHVNALRVVENYLFVGTSGSSTTMYNLESQKRIHEFDQRDWIRSIVYLGDGMIATTSDDTTLRIWDIHTGKNLNDKEMFPHNWWTLTFEIINETMFASGQYDGTVKIWNYKSNISTEMADK